MAAKTISQAGQVARITTGLGEDMAFLEGFTFNESLGSPFRLTCDVVCRERHIFGEQRGTNLGIVVTSQATHGAELQNRAFNGVLTEATLVDSIAGEHRYRLTARPWFWVLSLGRDCRIFANRTARQIITDVFQAAGVSNDQYDMSGLSDRGTIVREYCVQYEESDFAFVSRLMEEEGIYYYFSHTATAHTMHLCDSPGAHGAFAHNPLVVDDQDGVPVGPHLSRFHSHVRPSVASYALRDQHWRLFGDPRAAISELDGVPGEIKPKIFEYPGGFSYLTDDGATEGLDFAKLRLEAENAENLVFVGEGSTFAAATGDTVDVAWDGATATVLIVGATHRLSGQTPTANDAGGVDLAVEIETINSAKHFRAPRLTPKPFARGPQIATVVASDDKQKPGEIDIDKDGRVLVRFPWDRAGKTSCRVRASTSWAGASMGEFFFPRIGQEVLITYIDGDMDRPLVTGRVYDSVNEIPVRDDNKTWSGWRTKTVYGKSTANYDGAVKPPTDEPGYNAIAFNDQADSEFIYLRAQRDMGTVVFRDQKQRVHRDQDHTIGRNLSTEVKTGHETHKVTSGSRTTTINQDETLTVEKGAMSTTVDTGDQTTKISKGNQSTEVSMGNQDTVIKMGNQSTDVKLGNISIKADLGAITIEAMQSITLKVGSSKVVIDQLGVTVEGMMITTNAKVMHETKGMMTQVSGTAMLTLKGAITMIN